MPASAYYQRRTTAPKRWFAIARHDGEPLAMAGLRAASVGADGAIVRTYCLVTVAANADVAPIHDRMPLVLEAPDWPLWLGEQPGDRFGREITGVAPAHAAPQSSVCRIDNDHVPATGDKPRRIASGADA